MSTADISVLHSAEVVHFHHNLYSPKSSGFARLLNTSIGEWRGVHYEACRYIQTGVPPARVSRPLASRNS
jgi:hypothetical protein